MVFKDYWLPARESSRGGSLIVQTQWEINVRPTSEYHHFLHLLDQDGKLIAQYDNAPGGGVYSSLQWGKNQTWLEPAMVEVPGDTPPGVYELYAGWYRYPEITRLTVSGDGKRAAEGYVYLTTIEVK